MNWEYLRERALDDEELRAIGLQGWELVIYADNCYIFKRPTEQAGRRELDELRKLSDAATPGVWLADGTSVAADSDERRFLVVADRVKTSPWNASFIAAAVNHVRSLLAAAPSPATEPDGGAS